MKYFLSIACILLSLLPSLAPAQDIMRKEFEVAAGRDFQIVPIGRDGILLLYVSNEEPEADKRNLIIQKYDANFEEGREERVVVDRWTSFDFFDWDGEDLYLFFSSKTGNEYHSAIENYLILKYNPQSEEITSVEGVSPVRGSAEHFVVNDGQAFFGGRTRPATIIGIPVKLCISYCCFPLMFTGFIEYKPDPVLMNYNLQSKRPKLEPLNMDGAAGVVEIQKDTATKSTFVVISEKQKKTNQLHLRTYRGGKMVDNKRLRAGTSDKNLISGRIAPVGDDNLFVVGTYTSGKAKASMQDRSFGDAVFTAQNNGIYISYLEKGKQQFVKYHNFTDFKSMPVSKRVKRKKAKGKDVNYNYSLLFHDPIIIDNEIVTLAEVYYPEYETYIGADGKSRRRFVGFRYTHALAAGFDMEGKKLWDIYFPVWDILSRDLRTRMTITKEGDNVAIVYAHDGALKSMVVKNGKIFSDKQLTELETKKSDKVKANWDQDITYWYDNFYIAYGQQKVKDQEAKRNRNVFYFNKISITVK